MDINSWEDTWGTIDWKKDSEDEIKQKIIEFYHAGVDFNIEGRYDGILGRPLDFAIQFFSVDVIDLLIDGGADVNLTNKSDSTPLHWAAYNGKTESVKYLIERGPSNKAKFVNKQTVVGETALHKAAYNGHVETVLVLIEAGADVNICNSQGVTALHHAAEKDNAEMVQTLIKFGANVNIQSEYGWTALQLAARSGYEKTIKLLIENGADVNIKNKDGSTALITAAHKFSTKNVIKALIEAGADVNIQRGDGETALHLAVRRRDAETVKVLIENGANVNLENKDGLTALKVTSWKEIIDLIRNADKIRADYLKNHPESSLQQTLKNASGKINKMSLIKNKKTR